MNPNSGSPVFYAVWKHIWKYTFVVKKKQVTNIACVAVCVAVCVATCVAVCCFSFSDISFYRFNLIFTFCERQYGGRKE